MSMFDGDCKSCSEPSDSDWCLSCKKEFNKNNKELFKREYLCEWTGNSECYYRAYELWIDYEYNCEKFDRNVCHGGLDSQGFIKPANTHEIKTINQNANYLRDKVWIKAKELGVFDFKDFQDARRDVNRLSWNGIQEEYQKLFNVEEK